MLLLWAIGCGGADGTCVNEFVAASTAREVTEPDENNWSCFEFPAPVGTTCGTVGLCDDGNACEVTVLIPEPGTGSWEAGSSSGDGTTAVFTVAWGDTPDGVATRYSSISGTVTITSYGSKAIGEFEGSGGLEGTSDSADVSGSFCAPVQ